MSTNIIDMRSRQIDRNELVQLLNTIEKSELTILEIGCYRGQSTEIFLNTGKVKKIYCIDPWKCGYDINDPASISNMTLAEHDFDLRVGNDPRVIKIKGTIEDFVKIEHDKIDLVYIDSCHTYDGCKNDIIYCQQYIKPTIAFSGHDYSPQFKGVVNAVNEFFIFPDKCFDDSSWLKFVQNKHKICVLSLSTNNRKWLYDITNASKQKWCNMNKCPYIFINHSLNDSRHPEWSKIIAMKQFFSEYEYILWMDDDAWVINYNFKIDELIESLIKSKKSIVAAKNWDGLNTGIFCIKTDNIVKNMLDYVQSHYNPNARFFEQTVIAEYIDNNHIEILEYPFNIFNAFIPELYSHIENWQKYTINSNSIFGHFAGGRQAKSNPQYCIKLLEKYCKV